MTPEPSKLGKRKSNSSSKARNRRQKAKKKAARDRESASAAGVAAITLEGLDAERGRHRYCPCNRVSIRIS